VVPAIIVGLIATFLTIWFSLKENKVQEHFTAALIAHADKMTPLEEIKHDYHQFYGGSLFSPRCYINPIKGQELFDFHFNLITTEILYTIFDTFQAFKSKPEGDLFSSSGYPKSLALKRRFLEWEEFIEIFKKDPHLYDCLHQINPEGFKNHFMTLPVRTELAYKNKPHEKRIIFHNDFINFKIFIYQWRGRIELNEWKWILDFKDEEKDNFWISKFIIDQDVTTNKIRSGHPEMKKYEKWAGEIMSRLKEKFDYGQQLSKAMEYHHYFGRQISEK